MNGKILFAQARPPDAKELQLASPDMFVMQIQMAFGTFPVELGASHLERLEGMRCMWTDVAANPFDSLIRAIKRYGSINVWQSHETVREILEAEAKSRKEDG